MPKPLAQNEIVLGGQSRTWSGLLEAAARRGLFDVLSSVSQPIAVVVESLEPAFEAVAALVHTNVDGLIVRRERLTPGVLSALNAGGYGILDANTLELEPSQTGEPARPGRISLLTSGTTGLPKIVAHRWDTLFTGKAIRQVEARRWLVPYQVGTYAWFQIITLSLFQPNQTLVPTDTVDLMAAFQLAASERVDSISATPTFWRLALLQVPTNLLQRVPARFLTLGGETVDQAILDQLRQVYPAAQLTHIYASTEAGTCIVIKDGRAGFPISVLARVDESQPRVKVSEGRLWVCSPYSSSASGGDLKRWIDTGDLVEQRNDRVYFVGRADSAMINVGGNKAFPADIEGVLLQHPSIQWCRVQAVKAALVGYLPEADIVFAVNRPVPSEAELDSFCRVRLPDYAIPRFWNQLSGIPMQNSLKSTLASRTP